jgi:hypothetical protein
VSPHSINVNGLSALSTTQYTPPADDKGEKTDKKGGRSAEPKP